MSVRKMRNTYSSSVSGIKYSAKNDRSLSFESTLERDFIYLLEFDDNVEFFEVQPITIDYTDYEGKLRRYTPDFFVRYDIHTEPAKWFEPMLFEIKYRNDLKENWKDYKCKFQAALRFASNKGWRFKILTEKEIRTDYLINAKFLLKYRNASHDLGMINTLSDTIKDLRVSTPREIIVAASIDVNRRAELLHTLWFMIANNMIGTDFNTQLNMNSEIWVLDTVPPKFIKP